MKINIFLVFLFTFFMSCKPQGPEAKWVYGSWYEILDGGKIEFKKGGKVDWFGNSGTFTFEKKSTFILHPQQVRSYLLQETTILQ